MKNLTKILFCTFALALMFSCEPEEINTGDEYNEFHKDHVEPVGDTGDQGAEIDDKKD